MSEERATINVRIGFGWCTMWLFTVALAHLTFGQAALALIGWPYYLGDAIATLARTR